METLSIKISKEDKMRLRHVATLRKISLSALLREGVEKVVQGDTADDAASCYALAQKYLEDENQIGASGLGDLSVNTKRMESFGR